MLHAFIAKLAVERPASISGYQTKVYPFATDGDFFHICSSLNT
jgi:hypothetical protein